MPIKVPVLDDAVKSVKERVGQTLDQNGDGVFNEEDVMLILGSIYKNSINGIPGVSKPIDEFSNEFLTASSDIRIAAKKMIDNSIMKCTTSGFLTGFGGLITLPVALPANVTSVLYVQMRMIASLAYMAGLNVNDDSVQTLVYACLAGVSVAEIVKKAGIQFGQKLTTTMIKKIPGKALTKINQKVGFRFVTKFGQKGIVNLGKMVPVAGAILGGGFDFVETRIIATRAYKEFIEGDFFRQDENDDTKIT